MTPYIIGFIIGALLGQISLLWTMSVFRSMREQSDSDDDTRGWRQKV